MFYFNLIDNFQNNLIYILRSGKKLFQEPSAALFVTAKLT